MALRRFGQIGALKQEKVGDYKRLHAAVWPDVLKMISGCNLRNYSIFILGNKVVSYFEYVGTDYEADMKKMADDAATQRWWTLTKPCFECYEKQLFYEDMEEIFHFE
ncbi:MAG: L-rhamnose mutarotase [Sphaerochaetaceae bacterium]